MLKIIKLRAEHLFQINKTRITKYLDQTLSMDKAKEIEQGPYAFTIIDEAANILFCGGAVEIYEGRRAEAWAIFAANSRPRISEIKNMVKAWLNSVPIRRIEASAMLEFKAAHRLLKQLGFELEAPCLRAYHPQGHDSALYAIVKTEGVAHG